MENAEAKVVRHDTEAGRFYEIEGQVYPSSTTILEASPLSYGLREFLQENTKAEAEKKKDEAAIRGSKIHHTLELILSGRVVSPSGITLDQVKFLGLVEPKLVRYLQEPFTEREDVMMRGFMQFWEDYTPKVVHSELTVVYKSWINPKTGKELSNEKYLKLSLEDRAKYQNRGYAGTLDAILYIYLPQTAKMLAEAKKEGKKTPPRKRLKVLIDFKSGKGLYQEYDWQVGSYLKAYKQMRKERGKLHAGLLQLGINKCGYKLKLVDDPEAEFGNFLKCKEMWHLVNPNAQPTFYEFAQEYSVALKK